MSYGTRHLKKNKNICMNTKNVIYFNVGGIVGATEKEKLQRQSDKVYGRLTDDEYEALDDYTQTGARIINKALHESSKDGIILDKAHFIDSAMAKFKLENDITVFRCAESQHYEDWEVGSIKHFKAYMSTSISIDKAQYFYDDLLERRKVPILLKISVPKGTPGIYIGDNTEYRELQDEFLLGRKLNYRVVERDKDTLKVEVTHE
jgi:hypothetical protein